MGLGATVRCRCFEEGCLTPCPVPQNDLHIDADGYLASRRLDEARKRLDHRRFDARYGDLEDAFTHWLDHCCEHGEGDYCAERVGNIAGCAQFDMLVRAAGGKGKFPLLSTLLPHANGGLYPTEKARATLDELERFIDIVTSPSAQFPEAGEYLYQGEYGTAERLRKLLVASIETGNPIRWC